MKKTIVSILILLVFLMGCIPTQEDNKDLAEDTEKENVDSLEEDKVEEDLDNVVSEFPKDAGDFPTDIFG